MALDPVFTRYPELKELLHQFRQVMLQTQRPADEVILDDEDVMRMLKVSKRKLQYLKADRILPIHKIETSSPRSYYLLSDILAIMKQNRIEPVKSRF